MSQNSFFVLCGAALVVLVMLMFNGSGAPVKDIQMAGMYYESKPGMIPRFGIKFLDDTQVNLYTDDSQLGPTCTYVVHGNDVLITHACGVWHLDGKGADFYNEELRWSFSPKAAP